MLVPAREWRQGQFVVAGPQYPDEFPWPPNVERTIHLSPKEHVTFYGSQRFTLNITRNMMKKAGYSPSVRLFEAGACGTPIISDWWEGLDSIFQVGEEIFITENGDDTLRYLRDLPEARRLRLAEAARRRILAEHTPAVRAAQLLSYLKEMNDDVSANTSRRNGCFGTLPQRLAAQLPSELHRKAAGSAPSAVSLGVKDASDLLESSRTSL